MSNMRIEVLNQKEREEIILGVFHLLETTGVKIYAEQALSLLKNAGCMVQGNLVKIPRELVKSSIQSAPDSISIYDRNQNLTMNLFDTNSYFGPGVTCPYFYDAITLERKPATKQNVREVAKVADYLEHVDFLMSLCMISDHTPEQADIQEVHALIESSTKPICTWAFNKENLEKIIQMAEIAVGGEKTLENHPYMIVYTEPTTPLVHTKEAIEKLMFLAEKKIPCIYSPGMTLGGTAPITIAGALTVGIADALTGLVISQLTQKGAPIIVSSNAGVLDMRSLQAPYGSPEMCLIDAAGTQIYRHLGLPTFGLAGATDSKILDLQAGMEGMMELIFSIGSGANLVHDLGMMDFGMTGSLHYLIACNEMAAMAKRLKQGIQVDEAHLAAEVIHEVGPGGNFVAEEHTVEFLREEIYSPELAKRIPYSTWETDNKKNMEDRIYEKAKTLLEKPVRSPLEEEKKKQIDAILFELTNS